jgi:hypothetical protein
VHEVDDQPGSVVDATPDRVGEPHDRRDPLRLAADDDYPAELSAQRGHECQHLIRCQVVGRLDEFFTGWFDTAYPPGGGTNRPQLTGPGLDGPGFYNADGTCG